MPVAVIQDLLDGDQLAVTQNQEGVQPEAVFSSAVVMQIVPNWGVSALK